MTTELTMEDLKKNKYTLVAAVSKVARAIADDFESSEELNLEKPVKLAFEAIKNVDYKVYIDKKD